MLTCDRLATSGPAGRLPWDITKDWPEGSCWVKETYLKMFEMRQARWQELMQAGKIPR